MPFVIAYPMIDPVLVSIGPFPIRWYALAYITGLVLGWAYARYLVRKPALWGGGARPDAACIDDLLVYAALGVILGGRIGYVLFYNLPFFLAAPARRSSSSGRAACRFTAALSARRSPSRCLRAAAAFPCCALRRRHAPSCRSGFFSAASPISSSRELWGRPTDVAWAMVFPGGGPLPRHPSQLYEAALEGLVLFVVLFVAVRLGALRRPGLATGIFAVGYGCARIASEFFREPDPQLGFLFGGATMGMLLSLPMIAVGAFFIRYALSRKTPA